MKRKHLPPLFSFLWGRNNVVHDFYELLDVLSKQDNVWQIPTYERTITINVINNSNKKQSVRLFGTVMDLTDSLLDKSVQIQVMESSHLAVKTELITCAYILEALRYFVTTQNQFRNDIFICRDFPNGSSSRHTIKPLNYQSAQNTQREQIEFFEFHYLIDQYTSIVFDIDSNETITMVFSWAAKISFNRFDSIENKGIRIEICNSPVSTGLPQIDLHKRSFNLFNYRRKFKLDQVFRQFFRFLKRKFSRKKSDKPDAAK